jgi:UDP-glucuronate decarboxylase
MTGSDSKIVFKPLRNDDPVKRKPDISMARKVLNNWEPVVGLDEGLENTIAYFRDLCG